MQILMIVVTRQVKFLLPVRKRVLLEMRFATSKPVLSEGVTLHTMFVFRNNNNSRKGNRLRFLCLEFELYTATCS